VERVEIHCDEANVRAKRPPASATASRRIEADDIDAFTYSGQNRI
jgi:hypothetical protein